MTRTVPSSDCCTRCRGGLDRARFLTHDNHHELAVRAEQIQGQLNFIQDQVAEATVHVELHEKAAAQVQTSAVENPSLGSAWDRSIQGFLNVVSAVVIGLGYLLPIAVLALGIWLVTVAVRRRRGAS